MEHDGQSAAAPADAAPAPPVPPWEAELAAQALAELRTPKPPGDGLSDEQRRARRAELVAQMERETLRLEQEADLLNRLRSPGSLSGLSAPQLGMSLLGWLRRPEWLLISIALFCLMLWLIASGLRQWVHNLQSLTQLGR